MLDNTGTCGGTSGSKIGWNGDRERGLVCWDGIGVVAEVRVGDQGATNDRVGGSVHDGHICRASMGSTNVKLEVNHLSRSPRLNICGVDIGELVTLALPDVACLGVVVCLRGSNLKFSLDVSEGIRCLVVVDLGTASCFHSITSGTRCW